jgi:hypothetical protein
MKRMRKLIEQWNKDEDRYHRYEELKITLRLSALSSVLSRDEIDNLAWLMAMKDENPLDCVGLVVERSL